MNRWIHVAVVAISLFTCLAWQVRADQSDITIEVLRHKPCNMFWLGETVSFDSKVKSRVAGKGKVTVLVADYYKKTVKQISQELELQPNAWEQVPVELGKLKTGYYEMTVNMAVVANDGQQLKGQQKVCFGVAQKVERTAKEVRDGGYRFGLKMWYLKNAWWRGNADWIEEEAVDATCKLGLQWTRTEMVRGSYPTYKLMRDFPMNVIMKVESFPKEMFDEKRYGPFNKWVAKNGRAWAKKTLPQKEPYQKWLKMQLDKISKDQNVFEIWNEAWDKMSAEDLATISNWIVEVILKDRPDAIIGPNLRGNTSKYQYDAKYIDAGGMKGMKMVALHPYAGSEDRQWLRNYKKWLKEKTGRTIDIYVTEYGSHSCPEGPSKRSEEEQARRVVRQSLALYVEDVKAFAPHVMGQREQNPTYHEDWFGFIRLNHEPKPVLLALANCAKLVDASTYLGDLWFGPGVGAMLFEKDGKRILALFTREGEKEITIKSGVDQLQMVDIIGQEKKLKAKDGQITVKVSDSPIYLVGIGEELAKTASKELNPNRWPKPEKPKRVYRKAKKLQTPTMDGKFDDWKGMTELALINPKVNGDDASGIGYLAWNEDYLFVGINMRDNDVMNTQPRPKLYRHDSLELFVSTEPREDSPGYGPNDFQFFVSPTSKENKPFVAILTDREAGEIKELQGAKYHIGKTKSGWCVELGIPWRVFKGFKPSVGGKLALDMRVNDADKSHERWKIDPEDTVFVRVENPERWPILELTE